jgi:hypothetical protein
MHRSLHSKIFGVGLSVVAVLAGAPVGHADNFSTSITNPTPVPTSGIIAGNYPAGQADASFFFALDLKAGELATQISLIGGAQYKTLDFILLDAGGRKLDGYYITAGAGDNNEATRVFAIDAGGRYVVRLNTKGPETTRFRVALGGSALPNRAAAEETTGNSRSFLNPTAVGSDGAITGTFPSGASYSYYYFATDLKAGSLLTQMSVAGRQGASKWMSLMLLDDKGRAIDTYHMSRVEANADATKSFAVDRSGRYVLRLTVQGAEGTRYKVDLGGASFGAR